MGHSFWICVLIIFFRTSLVSAQTNPEDASALANLASSWQKKPSDWTGLDPCGSGWSGVKCNNLRVTSIKLANVGLSGTLSGDIGFLPELQLLDLSYNVDLKGSLPPGIAKLSKLESLSLIGCSFSGLIPDLSTMKNLSSLYLNSNQFSGGIPPSLGVLSKLFVLDLAGNELTGTIPVSNGNEPGLDWLTGTRHFHFGNNQLSGSIPSQLFSSSMTLIHVLFENNKLSGSIPSTLGLVKSLEVVRLDQNSLFGYVPSSINNLSSIQELYLSNNQLSGPLPNLGRMSALRYMNISNNRFDASDAPSWLLELQSLTTLVMEFLRIGGEIPLGLFSLPQLQTVHLRNNSLIGNLNLTSYNNQLQLIDLQNNMITTLTEGEKQYNKDLVLVGNPICYQRGSLDKHCMIQLQDIPSYSTSSVNCPQSECLSGQSLSPKCKCVYPFTGMLYFRAIGFSDVQNKSKYHELEQSITQICQNQSINFDSVYLHNVSMDSNNYLKVGLKVFPANGAHFTLSELSEMAFIFSNQVFSPPPYFGSFYFIGVPYKAFQDGTVGSKSKNLPLLIGASIGGFVFIVLLLALAICSFHQGRKVKNTIQKSQHFASWGSSKSSGSIPQLKGARYFSFKELMQYTKSFSDLNEIGSGGYGKVYKGILENGQPVAIKRARLESLQGALEFKTEIELLSRVHHKNLVSLIGFCFDNGEQILVYEYISNGTLREGLTGKSGVYLDWKRRLRVALDAARGLAYLHESASPPIIHRDVKSSNILLDDNLIAKVSDFGLSKCLEDDQKDHVSTQVKGTVGYLDPEYYLTQRLTEKSDVYSFGVLMLELLTGRKPVEQGRYIAREIKVRLNKAHELYGLGDLLDPVIAASPSVEEFNKFVDLAMKCIADSVEDRPMMSEVVKELEVILHLARLNSNAESAQISASFGGTNSSSPHDFHSNETLPINSTILGAGL